MCTKVSRVSGRCPFWITSSENPLSLLVTWLYSCTLIGRLITWLFSCTFLWLISQNKWNWYWYWYCSGAEALVTFVILGFTSYYIMSHHIISCYIVLFYLIVYTILCHVIQMKQNRRPPMNILIGLLSRKNDAWIYIAPNITLSGLTVLIQPSYVTKETSFPLHD